MLTKEDAPWVEYLVLDEETLESTLRPDTPQEIREAYENFKESERRIIESFDKLMLLKKYILAVSDSQLIIFKKGYQRY